MNIQAVKLELMQVILNTNNPNILNDLMSIVRREKQDFWELLSQEEKDEINQGFEEIDRGDKFEYDVLMKKYRK